MTGSRRRRRRRAGPHEPQQRGPGDKEGGAGDGQRSHVEAGARQRRLLRAPEAAALGLVLPAPWVAAGRAGRSGARPGPGALTAAATAGAGLRARLGLTGPAGRRTARRRRSGRARRWEPDRRPPARRRRAAARQANAPRVVRTDHPESVPGAQAATIAHAAAGPGACRRPRAVASQVNVARPCPPGRDQPLVLGAGRRRTQQRGGEARPRPRGPPEAPASPQVSGSAPRSEATTGVPAAMASRHGRPKPS